MASLEFHKSGSYRVRFRFGGRQFYRSLETDDETSAAGIKARIEETLSLLKRGVLSLPANADYGDAFRFIVSGGKLTHKPTVLSTASLKQVADAYFAAIPKGAKHESSLNTERTHRKHLVRILKRSTPMQAIGVAELQQYVNLRSKEKGRKGKNVQPNTVRKELQTFWQLRDFALAQGWVKGDIQRKQVKLPKSEWKPPFQTWDEIEATIKRGGLSDTEQEELWDSLFLREKEIMELLRYVEKTAKHRFIYPMFAFAAFTGARRSEIVRSKISDFNFHGQFVFLWERKRVKEASGAFRKVELHPTLGGIMKNWLDNHHSGGESTLCMPPNTPRSRTKSDTSSPLTRDRAHYHFSRTLKDSKWQVIKGFHTLRHSFISICAMKGVPQPIIDSWVGHETEEMKQRYRHLFPEQTKQAMGNIFDIKGLFEQGSGDRRPRRTGGGGKSALKMVLP